MFAPFTATAKEEILSPFPLCCADPALASCMVNLEKPHQGVAGEKSALHPGIAWSNSTSALGLRSLAVESRVRSRCTGKERDTESGLDNFGARYFASTLGRFMTPDWAGRPTTVPYANFGDPQSLNLYTYVDNAPLTRIDAVGHIKQYVTGHDAFTFSESLQENQDAEDYALEGVTPEQEEAVASSAATPAQNQPGEQVVFISAQDKTSQPNGTGTFAERTVDYEAGKTDKNGNIQQIDRKAKIGLQEKLDPNSTIDPKKASLANKKDTKTGTYDDWQTAPANVTYKTLRQWSVNGDTVRVLDPQNHEAYKYELNTMNANSQTPIKTEYTNTAPF